MTCHRAVKKDSREIQRLAALGNEATPFPSRQVYTVEDLSSSATRGIAKQVLIAPVATERWRSVMSSSKKCPQP
jgi:hypothetical protein